MRHLKSPLIGLGAAAGIWLCVALGQRWSVGIVVDWQRSAAFHTASLLPATLLLLAAVLGAALLALPRVSPVVSLTAGLVLLPPQVMLFVSPLALQRTLGGVSVGGHALPLEMPVNNGTLLLLSAGLLCASAAPARWRRAAGVAPRADAAEDRRATPGVDAADTPPPVPLRRPTGANAYDRLGSTGDADRPDGDRPDTERPAGGRSTRGAVARVAAARTAVFRREPGPRDAGGPRRDHMRAAPHPAPAGPAPADSAGDAAPVAVGGTERAGLRSRRAGGHREASARARDGAEPAPRSPVRTAYRPDPFHTSAQRDADGPLRRRRPRDDS
ncbi:hypothetical protein GCM10010124_04750 [Pilimelia terevasa]|uniref:Uncharacterized protein n=1 Tax=Pilimelia terevasa TaxID=53372 RepID=A0A8J3BJB7_9ACTN|nr:hypothetical protein [Pilimelia terevasa]GGK15220.1 hypothetical protein GCM10010124_04750 [Pilimelia terevasa]